MGSHHANWVAGLPFCADGEGDDSRRVSGEVVLAAGLKCTVPGISLLQSPLCQYGVDREDSSKWMYLDGLEASFVQTELG